MNHPMNHPRNHPSSLVGDSATGRAAGDRAPGGVTLRAMRWWDIEPVLALEAELFAQDAWSAGMLWAELAGAAGPEPTRDYVVAEAPGEVGLAGYAGLGVAGDTAEVMTIGVTGAHQGTGLGARLLTRLLDGAEEFGCSAAMLEVRVDNEPAKRLYHRFGFRQVGVRRGYYQPGNRDALVMRRELAPGATVEATHGES